MMRDNQTYSLTTILNSHHLQPQLYHQMIHQIKSPLQQQSFDVTNDNSLSLQHLPRRPNIPPPPSKSPLAHPNNHQFSKTYESMSLDIQNSRKKQKEEDHDDIMQSFLSPLEHEINLKEEPKVGFCGGLFDSILKSDVQMEIQIPLRAKPFKRKRIFQHFQAFKQKKQLKSLPEAVTTLQKIDQPELAAFLQLMGTLEKELIQIDEQKISMQKDLCVIFERLSTETQYTAQITELNDTHVRILRRLHSRNAGEVVKKVFDRKTYSQSTGERHLQQLFSRLNNIQQIICQFIKQEHSLDALSIVYQFIQQNFPSQSTFKDQLLKLYNSLGLSLSTDGLGLIWEGCLSKQIQKHQFIQGLSLNSYVVRKQQGFQSELYSKGFRRNEDE